MLKNITFDKAAWIGLAIAFGVAGPLILHQANEATKHGLAEGRIEREVAALTVKVERLERETAETKARLASLTNPAQPKTASAR